MLNQLCPKCAKIMGFTVGSPTKGICKKCGSGDSYTVIKSPENCTCDFSRLLPKSLSGHFLECPCDKEYKKKLMENQEKEFFVSLIYDPDKFKSEDEFDEFVRRLKDFLLGTEFSPHYYKHYEE